MNLYDKIKQMSVEKLANLLVIDGETIDSDENEFGEFYDYVEPCWYTPFGKYPGWHSKEDVVYDVTKKLLRNVDS